MKIIEKILYIMCILTVCVALFVLSCIGSKMVHKSKYITIVPNMDSLEVESELLYKNDSNETNQELSFMSLCETIIVDEDKDEIKEEVDEGIGIDKYYLKINYGANVITVYEKDAKGEYTVPVKAIICSTGRATPTSGVFQLKTKWRWKMLMGGVYGQYSTQITGNILCHSVPYLSKNPSSLEYWEYDKLGTKASAGCVRLTVEDAKWIFDNVPTGTSVEFYSSEDPGPLGKPVTQKISDNKENRGWDPTDPDRNNPWNIVPEIEEYLVQNNITI